jgi:hypothetical protein
MGGGRSTTEVKVPAWLEGAAQKNLAKADALAQIGYTPYYGPDVAAMTPMQMASMQGTNTAASAFGLPAADPMAGAPTAMNYGGMPAYSSGGMYDQALAELQRRQPAQYEALRAPFIDPVTGAQPAAPFGSGSTMGSKGGAEAAPVPAPVPAPVAREGGGGGGSMSSGMSAASAGGGFTGIRDMFDGGGAGRSGTTFSGGPLSGAANRAGISPAKGKGDNKSGSKGGASSGGSRGGSKGGASSGGSRGGSAGRR